MSTLNEIQVAPEQPEPGGSGTPVPAEQISYTDLYARWERGNWAATEIDFTEDARQWREEMSEFDREAALWNYALFFWGEDAVADNLSPYIDAAPLEEQKYFLTTQQVDEARHAVFFKRFMHEVCGVGKGDMASGLREIRPRLSWGFMKVFDRLDSMAAELRKDRSPQKLAAAITLYHLVIEASLAQPGQHMIVRGLEQRGLLPGFRQGMNLIAADEHRHIAFGVRALYDLTRNDPKARDAVAGLLRQVLPWTVAVLTPPNWDDRYTTAFGFTLQEIGAEGTHSLQTKLRAAGIPHDSLPGSPLMPIGLSPAQISERAYKMLRNGVFGEKLGPPARDPEAQELVFDLVRRSVAPGAPELTIQWEFVDGDVETWHMRVNGTAEVGRGSLPDPDVRLRVKWEDWVDVIGGRLNPGVALATLRMRPRGSLSAFRRLPQVLGR